MMNDGSEGRYGYSLFEKAANALLSEVDDNPTLSDLTPKFFDEIDSYFSPKQLHSHPTIACFSKNPDVLSQWRAYSDDGRGFSIGFESKAIISMPVSLIEVLYDPELQLSEMKNSLLALYAIWKGNNGVFNDDTKGAVHLFSSALIAYKDPSFHEEQEIRAIHELSVEIKDDGWKLIDEGGVADGVDVPGQPIKFRTSGSGIVTFLDIPFAHRPAIRELWLGPRNENGPGNVIYPLTQFGHRGVSVKKSASFYRG